MAIRHHVGEFGFTVAHLFHDAALMLVFHIDDHLLPRLFHLAVDFFDDNTRTRHGQLKSFTTQVFDQNRQVQFASA